VLKRLGIKPRVDGEYTDAEWDRIVVAVKRTKETNAQAGRDTNTIITTPPISEEPGIIEPSSSDIGAGLTDDVCGAKLSRVETATIRERLNHAKFDYDFNRVLLLAFQAETNAFFKAHGRTSVTANNGALIPIPSVTSTEKYIKLNIALSKLISTLEADLDLEVGGEDDIFG